MSSPCRVGASLYVPAHCRNVHAHATALCHSAAVISHLCPSPGPGATQAILLRRLEAKKARDFVIADALRDELLQLGLVLNERQRTFESVDGGFLPSGALPEGVDPAAVGPHPSKQTGPTVAAPRLATARHPRSPEAPGFGLHKGP